MDRIITISRWQWRAFWRRFNRAGNLNAGNQGILLICSILVLIRYLKALHAAAGDLPQNNTRIFASLLLVIFLVWMFPLVNNARTNISTRKLLHLPLRHIELFCIRLFTLLFPPFSWLIVAGSLAICYPITRARNPVAGVIAACLFIAFSALTGVTIAQLLSLSVFRKLFFAALVLAGWLIFYLGYNYGVGRVLSFASSLPASPVINAAVGTRPWLAVSELAALTTVAFFAAFWSFKRSLDVTSKPRSRRRGVFGRFRIPGAIGGLAAKDFRYFRRLLDPYLGVLAAALGCLYLITAEVSSATLFQVFVLSVFAGNAPLAFNAFGLDNRAAMDRLRLMPLTGTTIMLGKNVAFLMVVALQLTPLILLAFWRLGLFIGLLGFAEALAVAALYLAWGNWMSVNYPFKMQFFQFSSSSGVVVEVIAGILFSSLPGAIAIYAVRANGLGAAWIIALTLLASGGLYLLSVFRAGGGFSQKHDRIARALS
ncbi:MAG TPA: hypothetical protein VGW76_19375 [Pyrinomonadaceae bacterium]|nr:hypothetical protein [Pyrinomonadaceae bacterium]